MFIASAMNVISASYCNIRCFHDDLINNNNNNNNNNSGTLGTVTKNFDKWLGRLELDLTVEMLQRPCLLGTVRIIHKVLDIK